MMTLSNRNSLARSGALLLQTLLVVTLLMAPAMAQTMSSEPMAGDGLIVRIQSADIVFIDRGSDHGITRGDLFEIISS
jgi:hypothetical protein